MSLIVLLDAGPLGMITNPKSSTENEACKNWLASLTYNGVEVVIPEIADYEVRRELLRAGKERGLGRVLQRLASRYEASGGKLLNRRELEREIAERRGLRQWPVI
jgi:hypothetical protein